MEKETKINKKEFGINSSNKDRLVVSANSGKKNTGFSIISPKDDFESVNVLNFNFGTSSLRKVFPVKDHIYSFSRDGLFKHGLVDFYNSSQFVSMLEKEALQSFQNKLSQHEENNGHFIKNRDYLSSLINNLNILDKLNLINPKPNSLPYGVGLEQECSFADLVDDSISYFFNDTEAMIKISFSVANYSTFENFKFSNKKDHNKNINKDLLEKQIYDHFVLASYLPERITFKDEKIYYGYLFNCLGGDLNNLEMLLDEGKPVEVSGPIFLKDNLLKRNLSSKNKNMKRLYSSIQNRVDIYEFDPLDNNLNKISSISEGPSNSKIVALDILDDLILYADNNLGIFIGKEVGFSDKKSRSKKTKKELEIKGKYFPGPGGNISPFFNNETLLIPSSDVRSVKLLEYGNEKYAVFGLNKGMLKCFKINHSGDEISLECLKTIQFISMEEDLGVVIDDLDYSNDFPFEMSKHRENKVKNLGLNDEKNTLYFSYQNMYCETPLSWLISPSTRCEPIDPQISLYDFFMVCCSKNEEYSLENQKYSTEKEREEIINFVKKYRDDFSELEMNVNKREFRVEKIIEINKENHESGLNVKELHAMYKAKKFQEHFQDIVSFVFPFEHQVSSLNLYGVKK